MSNYIGETLEAFVPFSPRNFVEIERKYAPIVYPLRFPVSDRVKFFYILSRYFFFSYFILIYSYFLIVHPIEFVI